jgi:palmitoyltransferase
MAILSFRVPPLRSLAVPSVCLLICFLAYSSQYLFYHLEPGPLSTKEAVWFNLLVAGTWWSYERACRVDSGRLPESIEKAGLEAQPDQNEEIPDLPRGTEALVTPVRGRWCKKCEAVKPPRAHHCKQCGR